MYRQPRFVQEGVGAIRTTLEEALNPKEAGPARSWRRAEAEETPPEPNGERRQQSAGPLYVPLTQVEGSSARAMEFLPMGSTRVASSSLDSANSPGSPEPGVGLRLMPIRRSTSGSSPGKLTGAAMPQEIRELIEQLAKEVAEKAVEEANATNEDSSDDDERGFVHHIPEDCYGAAILSIVRYMDAHATTKGEAYRLQLFMFSFVILLLILNLVVQFSLLSFINVHVVHPAIHHVQERFMDYHAEAFDKAGNFLPGRWTQYNFKNELCQIGMTSSFSYMILMFVWVTSMMREVRTSATSILDIARMTDHMMAGQMISVSASGVTNRIVGLTSTTRLMVYGVVCIPKAIISVCLLILGCQWLSATLSFEALVMNTVAMEFVVHVDEVLYEAFLPVSYRAMVASSKFFMPFPADHEFDATEKSEKKRRKAWSEYTQETLLFVATVMFVYVYVSFIQDVLPNRIDTFACKSFLENMEPICARSWMRSLDFRDLIHHMFTGLHGCFPYGTEVHDPGLAEL